MCAGQQRQKGRASLLRRNTIRGSEKQNEERDTIAHVTRDIGIAEELAQDALVSALEQWPEQGIPENPGAWLMKAAKWSALDSLRRAQNLAPKHEEITRDLEAHQQRLGQEMEQSFDQVIDDDILRLLFTACHPVLAIEGRIALTLRILGGLTTTEIARAFLVPEKNDGPAHHTGEESPHRCARAVRNAARERASRTRRVCLACDLPDLQRGVPPMMMLNSCKTANALIEGWNRIPQSRHLPTKSQHFQSGFSAPEIAMKKPIVNPRLLTYLGYVSRYSCGN
jgi:DNA-directed RNA polymerase specialized sigma24 family protein